MKKKNFFVGGLLTMVLWSAAGLPDADARRRAYHLPHYAGAPTDSLRRSTSGSGGMAGFVLFWVGFLGLLGLGKLFIDESPEPRRDTVCAWNEGFLTSKRTEVERLLAPDLHHPELVDLILLCSNLDISLIRRTASSDPGLRRLVAVFDEKRQGVNKSYRDILSSSRVRAGFVAIFQGQAELAALNQRSAQYDMR